MLTKLIRKIHFCPFRTEIYPFHQKYPFSSQQKLHMSGIIGYVSDLIVNRQGGPQYTVEKTLQNAQIRKYEPYVVAETVVKGTHQSASYTAFHILAGYIFGGNEQNTKIQMTAPVNMKKVGEGQFAVQFVMPSQWKLENLPKPKDERITLKTVPSKKSAVVKYNGGWSENLYEEEKKKLEKDLKNQGMQAKSEPMWARFNSPMAPAFLRTNEVIVDL